MYNNRGSVVASYLSSLLKGYRPQGAICHAAVEVLYIQLVLWHRSYQKNGKITSQRQKWICLCLVISPTSENVFF